MWNLYADRPPLIGVMLMVWFGMGCTGFSAVGKWLGRHWTVFKRIGWNILLEVAYQLDTGWPADCCVVDGCSECC
jgi:hypothetical protein